MRFIVLIAAALTCATLVHGQSGAPPAMRSHVERFSTPAMRAGRGEAEATAKLKSNPDDAEVLNSRSLARMRLGRYGEAYDDLLRAVKLKPADAEYQANLPRQYEVRFELLAAYRALGDIEHALGQVDLLQDARPSDPRVTYVAALLAADRNDMKAAINGFQEALNRDPTLYGAWQDLGLAYIKLNQWKEAAATFGELAQRQADSVDAAYFHALALFNSGNSKGAESEARRALRLNGGAVEAQTLLGIILASRGNANAEASEALAQAVALDPTNFDAQFYLGRIQYALKDYAGSVNSLRAAVKLNPRHPEARFFLGTVLELASDSTAAIAEYQELLRIDPNSVMGQLGLGALLVKQGKVDEALTALNRAVALDPQEFEAHWALGRALALKERYVDAVESFQKAVALAPERSDAHYQLGLALKRLGRNEEAKQEFAIVERLNTQFRNSTNPK